MTDDYVITAVYDASVKYRLVEECGPYSFTEQEDGSLYTQWGFTRPDDAVAWFFGIWQQGESACAAGNGGTNEECGGINQKFIRNMTYSCRVAGVKV